jgi:3-hydroxyisobutyrate dehydrogenase-like beta-hydroxyacid dehydrogenase
MQTIGLIGVGRIGTEIAKLLLSGGYRVLGYRRSSLAEFEKIGGTPARSPAQIGEEANLVLSCLPGGNSLDDVVNGPNGLVHAARSGQIVAELGSHPLPAKERQVERLRAKGAVFLDGEVSGTPGMVAQRKAPIYLAGDAEACKTLEPIVKAFADIYLYLGAFGAASKIKFVNNLLVTINTAAIGEAVSLALKAGVDPDSMIKAITNGSGGKIHALVDTNGLPVRLALTAGEAHDNRLAGKLLACRPGQLGDQALTDLACQKSRQPCARRFRTAFRIHPLSCLCFPPLRWDSLASGNREICARRLLPRYHRDASSRRSAVRHRANPPSACQQRLRTCRLVDCRMRADSVYLFRHPWPWDDSLARVGPVGCSTAPGRSVLYSTPPRRPPRNGTTCAFIGLPLTIPSMCAAHFSSARRRSSKYSALL